jgi:hypothetical protein
MMHRSFIGGMTLAVAVILSQASSAQAGNITGSLSLFGYNGVTENGADLSTSTTITASQVLTAETGHNDYSPIGGLVSFGGPIVLDLTTLSLTTLSNATYGTFTASSVQIISQNATFLDVYVLGTFTPASGLSGSLTPSLSSLAISVNKNGTSLSEGLTLSTPPVAVPEPTSLVMSATGVALCGLIAGISRRSKKS